MRTTRQCAQVMLTVLLGLLTSMAARGQNLDATGLWPFTEIEAGKTCEIQPADPAKISGPVDIPENLTPANGGGELTVTKIGFFASDRCTKMTSGSIPSSVTEIAGNAFYWCTGLTSIDIPNGVETIGESAFEWCTGLTSVAVPRSVKEVGKRALNGCYKLATISLPSSVTTIGEEAFSDCPTLSEINVDPANTGYASEAGVLLSKDKTKLICYPAGKEGEYVIPNSVTTIEMRAFSYCFGLPTVTIPSSVTIVSEEAFSDCPGLTEIKVAPANTHFSSEDGALFNSDKTKLICFPTGKEGEYTIPSSVATIGNYAFAYCPTLNAVNIPSSVAAIGKYAFIRCSELTAINLQAPRPLGKGHLNTAPA